MKSIDRQIFNLITKQQECLEDRITTYIDINKWKIFPTYISSPHYIRMNGHVGFRRRTNIVLGISHTKTTQIERSNSLLGLSFEKIEFINVDYDLWEKLY